MTFSSILRRSGVILFTCVAILTSAASCSLPFGSTTTAKTLGILKFDTTVNTEKFARANAVTGLNGETDQQGLTSISVQKLIPAGNNNLYAISSQRGIFFSENGGQTWQRRYVFPLTSTATDQKQKDQDINTALDKNNAFTVVDIAKDANDDKKIYAAGTYNGVPKIYQSINSGETFKEVYSEVGSFNEINQIIINPQRSLEIYALLGKSDIIRSTDGGQTWGKLAVVEQNPVYIGITPDKNQLYVIRKNGVPLISPNRDKNFQELRFTKKVDATVKTGYFNSSSTTFNSYQWAIAVPGSNDEGWVVVADSQIWYRTAAAEQFSQMVLPVQGDKYNILDVELHPEKKLDKIYIAVDNSLFVTENRGESWDIDDRIRVSTEIGYINDIIIDPKNPNITYLTLTDSKFISYRGVTF